MKTIDVITIVSCDANVPAAVKLFAITEENKRDKIVKEAEAMFIRFAKELGIEDSDIDIDDALMDGYYECQQSYDSVSFIWSRIEI